MNAVRLRWVVTMCAALVTGAALYFAWRGSGSQDAGGGTGPLLSASISSQSTATPPVPSSFTPPLPLHAAESLSTADIALRLAEWPEGKVHADLPRWAALLAARGPDAVPVLASALATAGSNTARGVLADSLAGIGTDNAIQSLCEEAVKAPDETARIAIAASFRALSRPQAVPMLATLFAEADSGPLVTEASDALRRLADETGVHALADLSQEGGQLHAQRANLFTVLSSLENPDALPALEVLAADTSDPERARAAATGAAHLKSVIAERSTPR
jgi:hypothetical protein